MISLTRIIIPVTITLTKTRDYEKRKGVEGMINQSKYKHFFKMIIEISVSLIIACVGLLCFHSNNTVLQESTTAINNYTTNSISSTNEKQEITVESPAEETANTITQSDSTSKNPGSTKTGSFSGSQSSFTNKYGSSTTKCAHPGCNNPIASSGDTNCCTIHSKKCLECGKYIDEDATYCMDCITKATAGVKTQSSGSGSFSNEYGSSTTKCAYPGCNNPIASSGDTNCCAAHSNRCLECGKLIDSDAMYCMSCLTKALKPSDSKSNGGSSSGASSSGNIDFSGYSDSMSDAEFDAWLDDILGDY